MSITARRRSETRSLANSSTTEVAESRGNVAGIGPASVIPRTDIIVREETIKGQRFGSGVGNETTRQRQGKYGVQNCRFVVVGGRSADFSETTGTDGDVGEVRSDGVRKSNSTATPQTAKTARRVVRSYYDEAFVVVSGVCSGQAMSVAIVLTDSSPSASIVARVEDSLQSNDEEGTASVAVPPVSSTSKETE